MKKLILKHITGKMRQLETPNKLTHPGQPRFLRPGDGAPAPGPWWSPRRGLGAPGRPLQLLPVAALIRVPSASPAERHHDNAAATQANTQTVSLPAS